MTDRRRRRAAMVLRAPLSLGLPGTLMVAAAFALTLGHAGAAPAAPDGPGRRISLPRPDAQPVSLYYEEQGEGPPLLLLHGLGESTYTWREIAPALAVGHRVIALDLKGFGRSDKPDDEHYSADDQAALVARFILDRALEGVTLIGHSFGGTVALRTGLAEGIAGTDRIRRIAVIGAPALPHSTARYLDLVKTPAIPDALASTVSPETLARLLLSEAMGGNADVRDEDVEGYAAPYREAGAMQAFLATARSIVTEDGAKAVAARYKTLSEPVLVVWCRNDPIVSLKAGRRLAKSLTHGRLAILEGCHHLPQHEQPQRLLKALGSFLAD